MIVFKFVEIKLYILKISLVCCVCLRVLLYNYLAKLGDGPDESPTVMVGKQQTKQLSKNRRILKPSWAFVETNIFHMALAVHFLLLCPKPYHLCELLPSPGPPPFLIDPSHTDHQKVFLLLILGLHSWQSQYIK